MPTKRVRAAIVGGGIGGLSTANALLRRGIDVTVFEQVDTLREVGTGVSIFPNGRRQPGPRYGRLIAASGSNKMPMWRN
jgi:NADPH-dependent 2,4-dienoyl-CoA reductase/sulfur reductase-like enzyme